MVDLYGDCVHQPRKANKFTSVLCMRIITMDSIHSLQNNVYAVIASYHCSELLHQITKINRFLLFTDIFHAIFKYKTALNAIFLLSSAFFLSSAFLGLIVPFCFCQCFFWLCLSLSHSVNFLQSYFSFHWRCV